MLLNFFLAKWLHLLSLIPVKHFDESLAPKICEVVTGLNYHADAAVRGLDLELIILTEFKSGGAIKTNPSRIPIVVGLLQGDRGVQRDNKRSET